MAGSTGRPCGSRQKKCTVADLPARLNTRHSEIACLAALEHLEQEVAQTKQQRDVQGMHAG